MSSCPGCEILPAPLPEEGRLYLGATLAHTRAKTCDGLKAAAITFNSHTAELISLVVEPGALPRLVHTIACKLSSVELNDVKSLLLEPGAKLAETDLMHLVDVGACAWRNHGR